MKFTSLKVGLGLLLAVVVTGCAGMKGQPLSFAPQGAASGQYTAKADNFQIILDASQTMANEGQKNFITAKNLVGGINASLPADFPAQMGLRTYGHSERQSKNLTDLVYGMAKYSREEMQKGLDKVKYAGGNSPLGAAIDAAAMDLKDAAGTSALVIISDGTQNNMDNAVAAAQAIKAKMGDRLCIYTVWVGDDAAGRKVLEQIAKVGGCGDVDNAAALTGQPAFAAFMEKVFLKRAPVPVAPAPAPAPAPVPAPAPAPAPAPVVKEIITFNLLFDFDSAKIKDDMIPQLEKARQILGEDPAATFIVAGHTCSIGTDAYNQKLSERRAAAVKNWLVSNGVAAGRLDAVGYGESQPKYDNKTDEGRRLNRRVEIQSK